MTTQHRWTPEEAREAGKKGGRAVSAIPGYMRELGQKGGAAVSADREHMKEIGRRGGKAETTEQRQKAGRLGGIAKAGKRNG